MPTSKIILQVISELYRPRYFDNFLPKFGIHNHELKHNRKRSHKTSGYQMQIWRN